MADAADPEDARARGSRTYRDAHRSGFIEGAVWALGMEPTDVFAELVRRYGVVPVRLIVRDLPELRDAFVHAALNAGCRSAEEALKG
jgi:hypothetical protein